MCHYDSILCTTAGRGPSKNGTIVKVPSDMYICVQAGSGSGISFCFSSCSSSSSFYSLFFFSFFFSFSFSFVSFFSFSFAELYFFGFRMAPNHTAAAYLHELQKTISFRIMAFLRTDRLPLPASITSRRYE